MIGGNAVRNSAYLENKSSGGYGSSPHVESKLNSKPDVIEIVYYRVY